ncbi:MAG: hypothetical protein JXK05_09615 [Campylobacterales bacterium]|nr:hypothetical protein [Campylobacterales bacterium]
MIKTLSITAALILAASAQTLYLKSGPVELKPVEQTRSAGKVRYYELADGTKAGVGDIALVKADLMDAAVAHIFGRHGAEVLRVYPTGLVKVRASDVLTMVSELNALPAVKFAEPSCSSPICSTLTFVITAVK